MVFALLCDVPVAAQSQMDKDVYAYLFCTLYPGRTLIFVNAIACARRLAILLSVLRIPATALHAQMQQRQRLKSLVSAPGSVGMARQEEGPFHRASWR